MIAINEVDRLSREVNELVKEWGRLRRHPSTAVERAEIARRARVLLRWIDADMQAIMDELGKVSDKDVLRLINNLSTIRERINRIMNEVY
jgi:regulator of replication initiation timing